MLTLEHDTLTPLLHLVNERLGDFTVPLTRILEDGLQSAQTQVVIGKGGAWGGAQWVPMAASTIKSGRNPATLLVKTGALADSLVRGGAGNVFEVTATTASAGSSLDYAAYQDFGSSRIPAREFLTWYQERLPIYEQIVQSYITGEAAGNA